MPWHPTRDPWDTEDGGLAPYHVLQEKSKEIKNIDFLEIKN